MEHKRSPVETTIRALYGRVAEVDLSISGFHKHFTGQLQEDADYSFLLREQGPRACYVIILSAIFENVEYVEVGPGERIMIEVIVPQNEPGG